MARRAASRRGPGPVVGPPSLLGRGTDQRITGRAATTREGRVIDVPGGGRQPVDAFDCAVRLLSLTEWFMPRPRFLELPLLRRRALLDAAGRHFAAHGHRGASLNAILAEVGVSKGVAYYYFDDKADLFATVLEDAWAEVEPLIPAEDAPLWPGLHRLYRAHLALLRARPWVAELARHEPPPEIGPRLAPMAESLRQIWTRVQADGIRADLPPDLVAGMVQGLDAAIDRWWAAHPEATEAEADAAFAALKAVVRGEA